MFEQQTELTKTGLVHGGTVRGRARRHTTDVSPDAAWIYGACFNFILHYVSMNRWFTEARICSRFNIE